MAFTGFPATYQPMYYTPQYQPAQQQNNAGLIWVQGEAGAKSYLVAPNTTVALYDSERQTISDIRHKGRFGRFGEPDKHPPH